MYERILYNLLTDGIQELLADTTILERHFEHRLYLSTAEVAKVVTNFQAVPPNVIHHYAREGDKVPLFAIVLMSERESTQFLAHDTGFIGELIDEDGESSYDPDDPDSGSDAEGRVFTSQYGIMCFSEHPDVTLYNYEIAKLILQRGVTHGAYGVLDIKFSGQDLMPDPRYIPSFLFGRQLTLEIERIQDLAVRRRAQNGQGTEGSFNIIDGVDAERRGYIKPGIRVTDGS